MVLAGERLYLSGLPDVAPEDDRMAAFEGRLGSRFRVIDAAAGTVLEDREMAEVPVFDGMIAAAGRLYMCTTGGRIVCLGEEP
jgi:hypothetical protein